MTAATAAADAKQDQAFINYSVRAGDVTAAGIVSVVDLGTSVLIVGVVIGRQKALSLMEGGGSGGLCHLGKLDGLKRRRRLNYA